MKSAVPTRAPVSFPHELKRRAANSQGDEKEAGSVGAVLAVRFQCSSEQATWATQRKRGTPKLRRWEDAGGGNVKGETRGNWGEKRSAGAALLPAPTPTRARPGVHLSWEMSQHFGRSVWFYLLRLFIHLSAVKIRKETRPDQEERREWWLWSVKGREALRLPPSRSPSAGRALQLGGILALRQPRATSPELRKTLIVAR